MANKNTLRKRRLLESINKRGSAIKSENGGRWQGGRIDNQEKVVAGIREITRRIYGQ
jgi:hypothetical protein